MVAAVDSSLSDALRDRYLLERELGRGGMATVYLAQDVKHRRAVALKVLHPDLAALLGSERFLKEIELTAHLQHPHILPLFDSGRVNGTVYYVMPFVPGESLRDRLRREKQLPVADALKVATEVASALDYAHRHDVIHRDIKPENILLLDGQALVADFGIALAASKAGGASRLTETGLSLGTPHYMSPEQAMGERELTPRSDVYALGAVVYEMLTGAPPFVGPTPQAVVAQVLTETPRPLSSQRRSVSEHVEAAVLTWRHAAPHGRASGAGPPSPPAPSGSPPPRSPPGRGSTASVSQPRLRHVVRCSPRRTAPTRGTRTSPSPPTGAPSSSGRSEAARSSSAGSTTSNRCRCPERPAPRASSSPMKDPGSASSASASSRCSVSTEARR